MNQPSLLDKPSVKMDPIPVTTDTSISVPDFPKQSTSALLDFRTGYMMSKPEVMRQALAEYVEIRDEFRKWLLERLVAGTHYGYVPGCEPKYCDSKGKPCPKEQATATLGYKGLVVPLDQWQPKPSLYKAGAEMICDLLWARGACDSDIDAWKMMGSKEGVLVRTCRLYSKITGELLGQGTGSRLVGQKGGDNNNSIKMADKNATVAAVLNTWGLSDLFVQDGEAGDKQPLNENPEHDPNAPVTTPRDDRVSADDISNLVTRFKKACGPDVKPDDWSKFAQEAANRVFDVKKSFAWCPTDVERVDAALRERFDA